MIRLLQHRYSRGNLKPDLSVCFRFYAAGDWLGVREGKKGDGDGKKEKRKRQIAHIKRASCCSLDPIHFWIDMPTEKRDIGHWLSETSPQN